MKVSTINLLIFSLFLASLSILSYALYIPAKASLAQYLLEKSWQNGLKNQAFLPPWPGADTSPIVRMKIPSIQLDTIVLLGSTGKTLAFAPGLVSGSALPGVNGNSLISAHKDTHFKNLAKIQLNDFIYLEKRDGEQLIYQVIEKKVINTEEENISLESSSPELSLITCFPFNSVFSNPKQRFYIHAILYDEKNSATQKST